MHLGVILILAIVVSGAIMGLRRRNEINSLRQPKSGWHQGHKLRYVRQVEPAPTRRRPRRQVSSYVPIERDDLDDLDEMFESGDRPGDYD